MLQLLTIEYFWYSSFKKLSMEIFVSIKKWSNIAYFLYARLPLTHLPPKKLFTNFRDTKMHQKPIFQQLKSVNFYLIL